MVATLPVLATLAGVAASQPALKVLTYGTTPNGFNGPARGWNSFGLQANGPAVPGWKFDQAHVQAQCDVLASSQLAAGQYTYCSLDSGWSVGGNGDANGRLIPDPAVFPDLPGLATHLHGKGLKLGVYVVPGGFIADQGKTILGSSSTIGSVCSGNNGLARCNWDYTKPATQLWFNSVASQFASW